jgi:hypothetical protein
VKRIALISCGKRKLKYRTSASVLYVGSLFVKSLAFARRLNSDAIYILSAKHGLLELHQEIDPYEQTLTRMSACDVRDWSARVLTQLQAKVNLSDDHFIILAGLPYRRHLMAHFAHAEVPMTGLSIGRQLEFLNSQL